MPKAKDLRVEHDPVASSKRRWVDYFLVEGDGPPVRWVRVGREGILCCLRCNVVGCLHCDAVRLFLDGGTWKAPADGTEPPAGAGSSSAAGQPAKPLHVTIADGNGAASLQPSRT